MKSLRINLIGPPILDLPGEIAPQPAGKKLALLLYLAVRKRPVAKEELAELLWNGKRNNLRVALHRLRALPGAEKWLVGENDLLLECETDLERFEALLSDGLHREALTVWDESAPTAPAREALMQGFTLKGAPAFNDWLEIERRRIEGLYLDALQQAAAQMASQKSYREALRCWRRLLAEDPLHEGAHREVMRLEWLRGRGDAALSQFETCRRIMSEELGLEPLPETLDLYESIRSNLRSGSGKRKQSFASSPSSTTVPFVGRQAELDEVGELLKRERLVTLTGPGGVGKTRLAEQVAASCLDRFAHGTPTLYLADLTSADFLPAAMAEGIGLNLQPGAPPVEQLLDYLRDKESLLVVDNLEHLLAGAGFFDEILAAAPSVCILATSREALDLPGEVVVTLSGLPFPGDSDAEEAEGYEAVRLFALHARRADPGFRLSRGDLQAAARICRHLEGLPLGLELAGSWVRHTPLGELAGDLEANSAWLAREGEGSAGGRRGSLQSALDHSWELLGDRERNALVRLSVFRGGCDRESARAVAGADFRTLLALVNKSLLKRSASGRFSMLEVVRSYAEERLATFGEQQLGVRSAHARYFARRVESLTGQLHSGGQRDALEDLRTDIDNIRAAWQESCRRGGVGELRRMLDGVYGYHRVRGLARQGESLMGEAAHSLEFGAVKGGGTVQGGTVQGGTVEGGTVEGGTVASAMVEGGAVAGGTVQSGTIQSGTAASGHDQGDAHERDASDAANELIIELLGQLSTRRGAFLVDAGEYEPAEMFLQKGIATARATSNTAEVGLAMARLAECALRSGELERARVRAQEALRNARELADREHVGKRKTSDAAGAFWAESVRADALLVLGAAAGTLGDTDAARESFEQAAAIQRAHEDRWGLQKSYNSLGVVNGDRGEFEQAAGFFRRSLELARELGNRHGEANAFGNLGTAALIMEDHSRAREYFNESLNARRELGHRPGEIDCLTDLGSLEMALGRLDEAQRNYEESVRLARALAHPQKLAVALDNLALLESKRGRSETARELLLEALELNLQENVVPGILNVLNSYGQILLDEGSDERAARMLVFVMGHERTTAEARMSAEEVLQTLETRLGADRLERAKARHAELDLELAIEELRAESLSAP